ncbi:signal peptidase I [Alkalimonas collagenimarina]|uniref:Signal peptidase I n=1 Tax=Alkalimonas collagenimarina TaxID=400390 RepID=A0ABT9H3R1_9GAMM|nr:signal peptidase I [Alkalimonas collagenimarina]MDP4537922.1 signal peptidase I [Alkalimonas collagenimarina]
MAVLILVQSLLVIRKKAIAGVLYFLAAMAATYGFINSPTLSGYLFTVAKGSSSYPVIKHDDFLLSRTRPIALSPGTVVLITIPDYDDPYAKRIHGIPGDTIKICDTAVYVNGFRYSFHNSWQGKAFARARCPSRHSEFVLGADEYFVLGDAPGHSIDSRHFGTIRKQQIIAQAMYKGGPETGLQSIPLTATFSRPPQLGAKMTEAVTAKPIWLPLH